MSKVRVYFTHDISADGLVKIYEILEKDLSGRVAVKISTGELGGNNYLKPELIKKVVDLVHGTIVECNTAYEGKRMRNQDHLETIKRHGFDKIGMVDIMDSDGDMAIPVLNGKHLAKNYVGNHLVNYDSMLMLSHFKGHAMGGYGGALKNMSIGVASSRGKANIHTAGKVLDVKELWSNVAPQNDFLESMAEACRAVVDYMKNNIVYINVMNNLSVDCDCDSDPEDPCMADIGILASIDPVALDEACLDLIYSSHDKGRDYFVERVERQNGRYLPIYAEAIGLGSREYELIKID